MKPFLKLTLSLMLYSCICYAQNTKSWGTLDLMDNTSVSLFLNTVSNTDYLNNELIKNNSISDLNYLFMQKNLISVNDATSALEYATLFQTYLKLRNKDFYLPENRAIKPTETPSGGVLADGGNFFRIRLPYDGGFEEINNNVLLTGTLLHRGIQNSDKRRKLWKEVFLSAIIESEILSSELLGEANTTYQDNAIKEILNINSQVATGKDITAKVKTVAGCINSGVNIVIEAGSYGFTNIQDFLTSFRNKIPDKKFSDATHDLSIALDALSIGTEINSSVLKTYLLKTLQTAEADNRLEVLESWIYSNSPGYNDSEILNGFEDAKNEYTLIREETFKAITQTITDNPSSILLSSASIVLEETSKHLFENYYKITGVKLAFANGIIASVSAFKELMNDIDEEYDVLRLASISAMLEEYLSYYLQTNYSNISASELSIKNKSCLAQINSFLGYYYFAQIKQVYDNKWYSKLGVSLLINLDYYIHSGVTKEMLMSYCNEGISRNIEYFKQYSQPNFCAKGEIDWFNQLIENYYSLISKPKLSNGKVIPIAGTTTDNFIFSITYTDQSSNSAPPSSVKVFIDGTGYTMTKDPSDNDFTDGVQYTYTSTFASPKTYYYNFSANASDGTTLAPFPETGSLNFYVTQSSIGWEANIDPLNTNFSPASVKKGTILSINTGVKNTGQNTYSNITGKVEMRNSQGTLVTSTNFETGTLTIGNTKVITSQLTIPSNGIDGSYTLTSIISPSLDTDPLNNSLTNTFYIGENLGNEQFRSPNGMQSITNHTNLIINGNNFYLSGMNTSSGFATLRDPSGSLDNVYDGRLKLYSNYNSFIASDGVINDGGAGFANLYGAYVINSTAIPKIGPNFDNVEINAFPGTTIYSYVDAPPGLYFIDLKGDYELYSPSTTSIKNWFSSVSKVGTFSKIKVGFSIPSNAPLGKTVLYFKTKYSNSNYIDFTRLTFYITNPTPTITTISKSNISADDQIIITGTNLGTSGTIYFGNMTASSINWSNSSITCTVPQGVTPSVITVTNSNGTSNGVAYSVISSTGTPTLNYAIPDQTMSQNETRFIANLNEVFSDPNNGTLTYSATSDNSDISISSTDLSAGNLQLIASAGLMTSSKIAITATDNTGKSVSDNFTIFATKILKVAPPFAFVETSSGTTTFTVTSNVDWSVSESSDWLTATKTNATTLTVTYNANASVDSRSAIITLSGTGVSSKDVTVNQAGEALTLDVTPLSRLVNSMEGTTTFTVTANIEWTASSDQSWCTVTPSGTGNGTIYGTFESNLTNTSRTANIKISGLGVNDIIVSVIQESPVPVMSMVTSKNIGTDFSFYLRANIENTPVQIDFGNGIKVDKTVSSSYTYIDGVLVGSQTVKIYGRGIIDFSCEQGQLTSLDVSKNPELQYLNCIRNNLTSIDVSQNTSLLWLLCYSNQISALDVSHNTSLTILSCATNQLTTLDVTNNLKLESLDCSENPIRTIDISKNTLLQQFYCINNQLTKLDVSNNILLTTLYCYQNILTSLDLNSNALLTSLWCYDNKLTLASLPIKKEQWGKYYYAPQKLVSVEKSIDIGTELNLSDQFNINGVTTIYTWKTIGGIALVQGTDYNISDGITVFLKNQTDSICCEMTNATFPDFIGANVLRTTYTKINEQPLLLTVTPSNKDVTSTSGTTTFAVNTNISWTASSDQSWCTVTSSGTGSGTITVTYSANTGTSVRTANITVSGTGVSNQIVTVTQLGSSPVLTVTPSNRDVTSTSGTTTFAVNSNISWTASSDQSWCIVTSSGTGSGTITVTYSANTGTSERTANITISGTGVSNQIVTVTQLEPAYLSVSKDTLNINATANSTATFDITSNVNWNVNSDQIWLTASRASGSNYATITIMATANSNASSRTANITVSGIDVTSKSIAVTQAAGSGTSIENIIDKDVTLYPIPVIDKLNISFPKLVNQTSIAIYSCTGVKIYSSKIYKEVTEIDMKNYSAGIYLVRIAIRDNSNLTRKIVKQ